MTISRRTLTKGAAWAAPVVLASSAIPAYAASSSEEYDPVELNKTFQGLVNVRSKCKTDYNYNRTTVFSIERIPNQAENESYYVAGTKSTSVVIGASFTVYIENSYPNLQWKAQSNSSANWSLMAKDTTVPQISGFTAYTTTYTGDWSYDFSNKRHYIKDVPNFVATYTDRAYSCDSDIQAYSLRRVNVDGSMYELKRGPVNLAG